MIPYAADSFKHGWTTTGKEEKTMHSFTADIEELLENRLGEVMDQQFLEGCSDGPQDRQQLVVDRNRRWVEKMPTIMSAQPSLFVVGAGHLAGDDSVLTMLRQQGYVVEAVER